MAYSGNTKGKIARMSEEFIHTKSEATCYIVNIMAIPIFREDF